LNNQLHIVSFDVPYPPDYGGAIDIYYKIKALSELGIKVHLHCFEYGRNKQDVLNNLCSSVTYYKRHTNKLKVLNIKPYIMATRVNKLLVKNLLNDSFPVLLEGLHLGYYISILKKKNKKVFIRTHNIEHKYYQGLAKSESNFIKKSYFFIEAIKLKYAENILSKADRIFSISKKDYKYFKTKFENSHLIRAFHSENKVKSVRGKGVYALYHGNLSIPENIKAIEFLINVFKNFDYKFIIAGKDPNSRLIMKVRCCKNIELINNPDQEKMDELIANAHLNVLPAFQDAGLKLKLLKSLFIGRFVIVNNEMIGDENLNETTFICNTKQEWRNQIKALKDRSFSDKDVKNRIDILLEYSNLSNAAILKNKIFI